MSTVTTRSKIATTRIIKLVDLVLGYLNDNATFQQNCRNSGRDDVLNALHDIWDWLYLADEFWMD